MKLPIPFLQQKKQNTDYYLALILTDEKASAIILNEQNGLLKKVNSYEERFSISIEDIGREDFINIIDRTISHAEETLPPDIETHQTVFGVKPNWVNADTKKIKKEYLDKLKKVCDALNLTPIGFMVTNEAIIHLLHEDEGAPLSAIFAEVEKTQVKLSLFRGGKVVESVQSAHGESVPATVDKLLGHFTVAVLPARIILFLHKPDERTHQAFLTHQWSKSLPFLHIPQITVLPAHYDNRAVTFGAATQMGFKVEPPDETETLEKTIPDDMIGEEPIVAPIDEKEIPDEPIKQDEDEEYGDMTEPPTHTQAQNGGDFGFVINGEAGERPMMTQPKTAPALDYENDHTPLMNHRPEETEEAFADEPEPRTHHKKLAFLENLPKFTMPKGISLPKAGKLKGNKTILMIILPLLAIALLVAGTSWFYYNTVKATVLLTVAPKSVDQEGTITFSTTSASDYTNNIIAAKSITADVEGDISTDATGKKEIGEKAKGSITFYNNSQQPVNLNANAEIKSNTGEVFLLDSGVKIPAASGDIFTGTKPGTAQGNVTAKDIGTDGNIPSGTRFSLGGNDVAARNDNAFSGGTKKNVTVVSKEDLAKLRADLLKKMQPGAQDALNKKAESGETVLPIVGNAEITKEKFDRKDGEEAKKISLHATVTFTGMSYQNDEVKKFAEEIMKAKYNQDTTVAQNSVSETVKNISKKNAKTAEASITLQAGLLPKIDTQDVIDNIKDKSLGEAKKTIANLPQVTQTDIVFSPPIPLLPNLFPSLPKQIAVEIKTQ